jgi:hypothetical protein
MTQQETVTDRLVSIIQSIQLAQESGVLTVRRGEGGTMEEGTLIFAKGHVTQTIAGRRRGKAALNWLSTWGACRYVFVSSGGQAAQPPRLSSPAASTNLEKADLATRDTQPRIPVSPLRRPSGPLGNPRGLQGSQFRPGEPSVPLEREQASRPPRSEPETPFAIYPLEEALRLIEQGRLSRTHRQLFLLIDGQRSIVELSHLVGKSQEEANRLLRDLERIGVIHRGGA